MAEKFYYVDPINGHDDISLYDGESKVNAFKSIPYASIHGIPDGGPTHIYCRQGIYNITTTIDIATNSGSSFTNRIEFVGDEFGIIWPEDGIGSVHIVADGVVTYGIIITLEDFVYLKGFEISGFVNGGIRVTAAGARETNGIDSCFVHDITNSGGNAYGIDMPGSTHKKGTITNNIVKNITSSAIAAGIKVTIGSSVQSFEAIIINNSVYNISGVHAASANITLTGANSSTLNATVKNNIMQKSSHSLISIYKPNPAATINWVSDYNQFCIDEVAQLGYDLGLTYSDLAAWKIGTSEDTNSQEGNPLFVNAGGINKDDYKITIVSPCVDAGTNDGAPLEDAFGTARPVDGITDIGAHEKVPATIANVPGIPTVRHISKTELRVIIDTNNNLIGVKYVIQETTTGNYVNKTTGALQAGEDWGTFIEFKATIGQVVTGLANETEYTFKVKARNTDLVETAYGDPASATTYLDQLYPDHPLSSLVHNLGE